MSRPALFLDRDGVINVERDYVHRIEDFEWRDGVFDLARAGVAAGFLLVVVTNQSGIGRGYYSVEQFEALTAWMEARFAAEGAALSRTYFCPHHPDASVERFRADHPWRKPRPGMLLAARDDLGIDLARSVMIGDRWSDMEAGAAAGLRRLALVGDLAGARPPLLRFAPDASPVRLPDVVAAARWLTQASTGRMP